MVEQNRGGAYTQIVYGPDGSKLALMNGVSTLQKAFVPLPGGATAVYGPSGLLAYRHPDWLGSSRFAHTPSRTVYYDGSYGPFGEPYAETGAPDRSFTGQTQDTVPGTTGFYDFMFREYSPVQGRWISPDPAGISAAELSNPQSWNRYAYAYGVPLNTTDPLGLCVRWVSVTDPTTGNIYAVCDDRLGGGGTGTTISVTVTANPTGFLPPGALEIIWLPAWRPLFSVCQSDDVRGRPCGGLVVRQAPPSLPPPYRPTAQDYQKSNLCIVKTTAKFGLSLFPMGDNIDPSSPVESGIEVAKKGAEYLKSADFVALTTGTLSGSLGVTLTAAGKALGTAGAKFLGAAAVAYALYEAGRYQKEQVESGQCGRF